MNSQERYAIAIVEAAKVMGMSPRPIQLKAKRERWQGISVPGSKAKLYGVDLYPESWRPTLRSHLGIESSALVVEAGAVAEINTLAPVSQSLPESYERAVPASDVRAASIEGDGALLARMHPTAEPVAVAVEVLPPLQPASPTYGMDGDIPYWKMLVRGADQAPSRDTALRRKDARSLILDLVGPWCEAEGIAHKVDCENCFCRAYNQHLLGLASWVYEVRKSISRTTLHNWRKRLSNPDALQGYFAKPKGGAIAKDPELLDHVEQAIARAVPNPTPKRVQGLLQQFLDESEMPSYPQILRFIQRMREDEPVKWALMTNRRQYKDKYRPRLGSASEGLRPNQLWEIDFTKPDVLVTLNGKTARYAVGMCIDVATRRRKCIFVETPKGGETAALLLRCIREWGVPEVLRPDNGKEFSNKLVRSLCAALGIDQIPPPPGQPHKKPHVERNFGTLNKYLSLSGAYVGRNTAQRASLREHKSEAELKELAISTETMVALIDKWATDYNQEHVVQALGKTPNQAATDWQAEGWAPVWAAISEEHLRRFALEPVLKVVQAGGVTHNGRKYIAGVLGDFIGQQMLCYPEPGDFGILHAYDSDFAYVGALEWDEMVPKERRIAMAKEADAFVGQVRQEVGQVARKAKSKTAVVQKRPELITGVNNQLEIKEELREVFTLPAAEATDKVVPMRRLSPEDEARKARLMAEADAERAKPARKSPAEEAMETRQKAYRCYVYEAYGEGGGPLDAAEAEWWEGIKRVPSIYQGHCNISERDYRDYRRRTAAG